MASYESLYWSCCQCSSARTKAIKRLLYLTAGIMSTLCAVVIHEYDVRVRSMSTCDYLNSDEIENVREMVSYMPLAHYIPSAFVEPPPSVFIMAVGLYTVIIVITYCVHKDDKHQKMWLASGGLVSALIGFIYGTDAQSVLVRLLPGIIIISLFLSAITHHLSEGYQQTCDCDLMKG
ncbi:hypothetical protein F4806DRAFT_321111 [Annulohypoxylon nitens]|nr:hypothetical protein F4806DRAFT_321111 [Annulohypoxylon nitens]